MTDNILEVEDLRVYYRTRQGHVKAVNGVSFGVRKGEVFGIVGESGSGKTTVAKALVRVVKPPCTIEGGKIKINGRDTLSLSEDDMRRIRWNTLSLIPQGSMNSLNPVMRVERQIADGIHTHDRSMSNRAIRQRIGELMGMVDLPSDTPRKFPHELSGGMKQRVCIAMAVALNPQLIIADEFTSALDVVVQRVVVQTLKKVIRGMDLSLISIGHNMGLQAQLVDRMAIVYGGRIAEIGKVSQIYSEPLHPYTKLLIGSVPSIETKRELKTIGGFPPSLLDPPPGCIFHPRCPKAMDLCKKETPECREIEPERFAACHLY